ncbi:MAG: hypothetical protein M1820_002420 [Bogoriella megaspora]|nr:MAG: hypothetical protein M1820_002420 [Bogoriella megaspora]
MDLLQDWASYIHYLAASPLSPYYSYTRPLTTLSTRLSATLSPLLTKLQTSPDLASIALLLLILFLSLRILNILYGVVRFWVRLVWNIVWWGSILGLGVWLYTRGVDGVVQDMGKWFGVWKEEVRGWEEKVRVAEAWNAQQARGQGRWG